MNAVFFVRIAPKHLNLATLSNDVLSICFDFVLQSVHKTWIYT